MNSHIKIGFRITFFFLFIGVNLIISCKKFVQINPPNSNITSETVYSTNTSAAAAVTGIYYNMMAASGNLAGGSRSISTIAGLEADELKTNSTSVSANFTQPYTNSLLSTNPFFWNELYSRIYQTNAVLEGINGSTKLSDSIRQQLIGETEFMRAFFYFYAVNLFGDVPLTTTTDYKINNIITRSTSSLVYQQIVIDLKDAQLKLKNDYADYQGLTTTARIRPNKGSVEALLARVYLYQQKWDSAEAQANLLINDPKYGLARVGKDTVFLTTSKEAIWQLQNVLPTFNTFDANLFVIIAVPSGSTGPVSISNNLLNAFEPGDKRLLNWVSSFTGGSPAKTYYFPFKYQVNKLSQPITEYTMVLRLAEQYLIRAEARAQQNNLVGAISDLNAIRQRAGLPLLNAATMNQAQVLAAIMHERQVELFTEWGHRWFDLKRTGQLDTVMGGPTGVCQTKGGTWNSNKALMPLPSSELLINTNLTQNPGY